MIQNIQSDTFDPDAQRDMCYKEENKLYFLLKDFANFYKLLHPCSMGEDYTRRIA